MVKCDIGTTQSDDGTIKWEEKKLGYSKCDKSTIRCDIGITQYDDETIKCENKLG